MKHEFKVDFYIMKRFRDFLKFRPSGLITTLTYVLMDNFGHCFYLQLIIIGGCILNGYLKLEKSSGKKIYNDINDI